MGVGARGTAGKQKQKGWGAARPRAEAKQGRMEGAVEE